MRRTQQLGPVARWQQQQQERTWLNVRFHQMDLRWLLWEVNNRIINIRLNCATSSIWHHGRSKCASAEAKAWPKPYSKVLLFISTFFLVHFEIHFKLKLGLAIRMSAVTCQQQFEYERWNCSLHAYSRLLILKKGAYNHLSYNRNTQG